MRNAYDFYPTPEWCYEKLPINWNLFDTALEPAAGDGRIVRFLQKQKLQVSSCEIQEGTDFFEHEGNMT